MLRPSTLDIFFPSSTSECCLIIQHVTRRQGMGTEEHIKTLPIRLASNHWDQTPSWPRPWNIVIISNGLKTNVHEHTSELSAAGTLQASWAGIFDIHRVFLDTFYWELGDCR